MQVLGEGRLTDAAGRVADFRNCVILMTSNLGVEKFGLPKSGFGTDDSDAGAQNAVSHFTAEASRLLRPEMLNRIDRIVPFLPLSKTSLRKILDIEFRKIETRYGLASRPISLEIDDAVYETLIARGYDPRFGARSLRRTIEREFLLPLAKSLRKYQMRMPLAVRASFENGEIQITAAPTSNFALAISQNTSAMTTLGRIGQLRQYARRLREHSAIEEMKARINRAENLRRKYRKRIAKKLPLPDEVRQLFASVEQVDKPYVKEVNRLYDQAVQAEEEALFLFYGEQSPIANLVGLKALYDDFVERLYREVHGKTDRILLAVYGKSTTVVHETINIYKQLVEELGFRWSWYALEPCLSAYQRENLEADDRLLGSSPVQVVARHLHKYTPMTLPQRSQIGQLLVISGRMAGEYFSPESGKVRFLESKHSKRVLQECSVQISDESLDDFCPPVDLHGNADVSDDCISRNIDASLQRDSLIDALAESFRTRLESQIESWVME